MSTKWGAASSWTKPSAKDRIEGIGSNTPASEPCMLWEEHAPKDWKCSIKPHQKTAAQGPKLAEKNLGGQTRHQLVREEPNRQVKMARTARGGSN